MSGTVRLCLILGLLIVAALALASYALARGSLWTRFVLPLLLSATVALHIQVSLGMIEFHFGVFVTLALVMVYRDWRVVLACAAFFAVHHVLFDRLQAWGLGMYCLTEASFPRVLLHAAYVVLQTGVEIFIVYRMNQAFSQGRELNALVQQVERAAERAQRRPQVVPVPPDMPVTEAAPTIFALR